MKKLVISVIVTLIAFVIVQLRSKSNLKPEDVVSEVENWLAGKIPCKTFKIDQEWDGSLGESILFTGSIVVDQRILDAVDDGWRKMFYSLNTDQEVAEHLAYNLVVNGIRHVQQLDGWADMPDDVVLEILQEEYNV